MPDVNVWLALSSQRHIHARRCTDWIDSVKDDWIAFCRVTQMGLLRLLTTQAVMLEDALTSRQAWQVYKSILADQRVTFATEPLALDQNWRKLTLVDRAAPKLWTDAYLSAFAAAGDLQIVTLDKRMRSLAADALVL